MPDFTVITENDESQWEDQTGSLYHFPKRYLPHLKTGTRVLYYKGKIKNARFAAERLSPSPHYFATAEIGQVWPDPNSAKGDYFAQIENFQRFNEAVLAKQDDEYLESIPQNRQSNYWRDGVRPVDAAVVERVLALATLHPPATDRINLNDEDQGEITTLESGVEGAPQMRYVTQYERDPALRRAAIALHGVTCVVCGFNFGKTYGELGDGFIHIHHLRPVAEMGGPSKVNPASDMVPVCANCHAIIHRRRDKTLSIDELKSAYEQA